MKVSSVTWVCPAGKQGDGLIPLSVSCKWGKVLQSEGSNFQLFQPHSITQELLCRCSAHHTQRGHGLISRAGSPRAGPPWREETNYLFSASSLSFTWETHFYFPHLYIRRKHLSGSYFFIWVMNFYFLAFSETPVFTVSRLSINTALFQTIFLSASRKGKKKSLYCLSWLLDSHSPGLVNSILSNPWKCFFVLSFTLRIL